MSIERIIPVYDPMLTRLEWVLVIVGCTVLVLLALWVLVMFING